MTKKKNPREVPELTAAQSRKRFAALKKAGCKPKRVTLPDGTGVVVRQRACSPPPMPNPSRPPSAWFDDCIRGVEAAGRARGRPVREPRAVCGAAWWKLPPARRAAIVRRMERDPNPQVRGGALALARAEKRRAKKNPRAAAVRRSNPREVVSLVYLEQKQGDREPYEYEHEFEGERPQLTMRGGKAQLRGGSYRTRDGWLEG